jgi:RHS repeat-associated protein
LVLIIYPGQPGKQTAFTYDGLDRRRTITSTPPGGGSAVTTAYLWCGEDICQSRDGSNTPIRSYYDEGEYVPGTPASLYYGIDQIGSVRRVFASTTSAPAYGYDPYGLPLQTTAPLTDFVYGGMFYNADSGLYLTNYRAYDPVAGRWLSRDPIGEVTDPEANLYAYVGGNPIALMDPSGLGPSGAAIGGVFGAIAGALAGGAGGLACGPGAVACSPSAAMEGGALGAALGAAIGSAVEDTMCSMAEHVKNPRPSNLPKHEKGQSRKKQDYGQEKGDDRRDDPRKRPKGHKGPYPPPKTERQ